MYVTRNFCLPKIKVIFIFILIIKIFVSLWFTSGYQQQIFVPFLDYAVTTMSNPWQHFYLFNQNVAFPYPALMLYLLSPFYVIGKFVGLTSPLVLGFLIKMPNFIADIIVYYLLNKLLPNKIRDVLVYYWCSPIIIYTSYIQGTLDLIPVALLFLAIYTLLVNRLLWSAIFFAGAVLCKLTALLALPLIALFIVQHKEYKKIANYVLVVIMIFIVLSFPFMLSDGYNHFIFFSKETRLLFSSYFQVYNLQIYPIIIVITLLYILLLSYRKINQALLLSFMNLIFVVLLIFAYPIPSWFVWCLPYLTWFVISFRKKTPVIKWSYIWLNLIYILYFMLCYKHPFNNFESFNVLDYEVHSLILFPVINNVLFTLLVGVLVAIAYLIHHAAKQSNALYNGVGYATAVGISGDSGAGKSILLDDLRSILGTDNVTHLEGDGEHKWERGHEKWQEYTHLDPKANLLHQQVVYIEQLKKGDLVYRRDYDHNSGKFTETKPIYAKQFVVIAGLHVFYLPLARKVVDVKIFVDTDNDLRKHWKILRDKIKRGYTKEQVLQSLMIRDSDRNKYILPQKDFADLVFQYVPSEKFEVGDEDAKFDILLKVSLSADINVERLDKCLSIVKSLKVAFDYSNDLKTQEWVFSGVISVDEIESLSINTIDNLDELTGTVRNWSYGLRGLRQYFALLVISHNLRRGIK